MKEIPKNLIRYLLNLGLHSIEVCGSFRRGEDSSHDIDLMAMGSFSELNSCPGIITHGEKKSSFLFKGMQVDIYLYEPQYKGAMMMHLTGPGRYNMWYRVMAKKRGLLLNQYGLWKGTKRIAGKTEQSIYFALGKEYKEAKERGK